MSALPPKGEHARLASKCPLSAIGGLMHCSKQHLYSITSSARASTVVGKPGRAAAGVLGTRNRTSSQLWLPTLACLA
jgi:hypothetical protein